MEQNDTQSGNSVLQQFDSTLDGNNSVEFGETEQLIDESTPKNVLNWKPVIFLSFLLLIILLIFLIKRRTKKQTSDLIKTVDDTFNITEEITEDVNQFHQKKMPPSDKIKKSDL